MTPGPHALNTSAGGCGDRGGRGGGPGRCRGPAQGQPWAPHQGGFLTPIFALEYAELRIWAVASSAHSHTWPRACSSA